MGPRWIKISVIYFLIGVLFGLYMHSTIQLQWGATHAHINVVGWLSTAVIGVIYALFPQAGNSKLGVSHFWLHNIGLPILLIGMLIIQPSVGAPGILIALTVSIGGYALLASIIVFIINVFKNIQTPRSE